jgi:hypothetical protein
MELVFIKISQASVLLPLIAGLRNYRFLSRSFRVFILLFVSCMLLEIAGMIMKAEIRNNMPAYNLVPFVEFYFLTMLYMDYFSGRKYYDSFFAVCIAVFTAIALLDLFVIHRFSVPNTYAHSLESFILVIYSLIYFYDHFTRAALVNNRLSPMFWVNAGVFIYFPVNMVLFLIANYLIRYNINLANQAFTMHSMFNIILNVCFAWAFICHRKKT